MSGEWLMALGGAVGIAFGVASIALSVGSATLARWVGGYRLVDGAILAALALRLRSWEKQAQARSAAEAVVETALDVSFEPAQGLTAPVAEVEVEEPMVDVVLEPVVDAHPTQPVASPSAE